MEAALTIRGRIAPLARRVRWYRGIYWSARFLLYSLLSAIPLLLVKSLLPGPSALWIFALVIIGTGVGLVYGLSRPVPLGTVARLVEERLDLKARLSTALELHDRHDDSPFAIALYRDALRALPPFTGKEILPVRAPRECWSLLPAAAAVLLLYFAFPVPWDHLASFGPSSSAVEPQKERPRAEMDEETGKALGIEAFQIRDRRWSGGREPSTRILHEIDALFKDSPLAEDRPDFSSFLRQGDERMRLLGRSQVIPNLRGETLRSPYEIAVQKMQDLAGDGGMRRLTPEELRQILSEVRRMGDKGGSPGYGDSGKSEGLSDLTPEGGRRALEEVFEQLKKHEEGQLKSSEVHRGPGSARRGGPSGGEESDQEEPGLEERFGPFAGRGRSDLLRGDPAPRLGVSPEDMAITGDRRSGPSRVYDTNLLGGEVGKKPARRPQAEVLTRYRQIVEEALSREPIPPDYREQVKTYFDSLLEPSEEGVR